LKQYPGIMSSHFTTTLLETINLIKTHDISVSEKYFKSLTSWNDEIETFFLNQNQSSSVQVHSSKTSYEKDNEEVNITTVEEAAVGLHDLLIRTIITCSPSLINSSLIIHSDEDTNISTGNTGRSQQWEARILKYKESNSSETMFKTNEESNEIAYCIARNIASESKSIFSNDNISTKGALQEVVLAEENVLVLISQLLRTSKNLIRYNRVLLSQQPKKTNKQSDNENQIFNIDASQRLCCLGMTQLYLNLLEINSIEYQRSRAIIRSDIAKYCCINLFHATFGHAIEPISKKALAAFVQNEAVSGISTLAKLLLLPNTTHVMLVLMKLLHNIVGNVPDKVRMIDAELEKICNKTTTSAQPNLFTILVSTLAWCIRSKEPAAFPGYDIDNDKRAELATEIINVLFAVRNGQGSSLLNSNYQEVMTQLGIILVDILHLPNQDTRVYECKLSSLILLMDAPLEFTKYIHINNGIPPLLTMLWIQLNEVIIKNEGEVQGKSAAATILPILIVLNNLSLARREVKKIVKEYIFPPELEQNFTTKMKEQAESSSKNMKPLDSPSGTTRWKLIKLMTYTESNVKRYASELLWNLCNGDPKEFVARTGFGNAVHLLGVRGFVKIPQG